MVKRDYQSMYESILEEFYRSGEADFFIEIYPDIRRSKSFKDYYVDFLMPVVLKFLDKKDRVLDIADVACRIMHKKKIKKIINCDIFEHIPLRKYDVVLFIRNYSIFGRKEENIVRLLVFLKNKITKKGGKLIFFLKESGSGRTQMLKRRLIFRDRTSFWLESIYPSIKEMTKLAKKNGWSVVGFRKDKKNNYALILKKC